MGPSPHLTPPGAPTTQHLIRRVRKSRARPSARETERRSSSPTPWPMHRCLHSRPHLHQRHGPDGGLSVVSRRLWHLNGGDGDPRQFDRQPGYAVQEHCQLFHRRYHHYLREGSAAGASITVNYIYGGWMAGGTGLMDEDGSHITWVGTNPFCLEGADPNYPTFFSSHWHRRKQPCTRREFGWART